MSTALVSGLNTCDVGDFLCHSQAGKNGLQRSPLMTPDLQRIAKSQLLAAQLAQNPRAQNQALVQHIMLQAARDQREAQAKAAQAQQLMNLAPLLEHCLDSNHTATIQQQRAVLTAALNNSNMASSKEALWISQLSPPRRPPPPMQVEHLPQIPLDANNNNPDMPSQNVLPTSSTSSPVTSKRPSASEDKVGSKGNCNSSRYKTELCRPFEESGFCKYGDKCQFAHGEHELRSLSRHPKYKTELCRTYHTVALCPYGPRCHFIHNEDERRLSQINQMKMSQQTTMTQIQQDIINMKIQQQQQQQQQPPRAVTPPAQTARPRTISYSSSMNSPSSSVSDSPLMSPQSSDSSFSLASSTHSSPAKQNLAATFSAAAQATPTSAQYQALAASLSAAVTANGPFLPLPPMQPPTEAAIAAHALSQPSLRTSLDSSADSTADSMSDVFSLPPSPPLPENYPVAPTSSAAAATDANKTMRLPVFNRLAATDEQQ